MSDLNNAIQQLTETFANNIITAIRGYSIEAIMGSTGKTPTNGVSKPRVKAANGNGGGRLPRRSEEDIAAMVDKITGLLAKNKEGLRAEQIRDQLGVQAKELPRPLADGLKTKRITSKGEKRARTYFAAGGAAKKPAAKATKKAPAKPAKKK